MIVSNASIHVQIFEEGLTDHKTIPSTLPVEIEHFAEEAFAFFQIPHRYVYSGVRADRPTLLLIRATGQIELPTGEHRLLCLLYTSPSPRDLSTSRMPSSA